jgi:hypothetical protein
MASVYKPLKWQAELGLSAATAFPDGKPRCRACISTGRTGLGQCGKHGKVQDENGIWWCAVHDPEAERRRNAERNARYNAQAAASQRRWAITAGAREFHGALKAIRDGHNDPRALAAELLAKFPELDE